ncbi:MAG: amine oxidase [Microbacterium sp.]|nr:amine oxidase [Microbacterium sp.]
MIRTEAEVVVIGGGLAGVTAARDLARAGVDVLLLEAGHRLGGRAYRRGFAGGEPVLEFGGTWLIPGEHLTIEAELAGYGIPTERTPDPDRYVIRTLGARHETPAIPESAMVALEAALDPGRAVQGWQAMTLRQLLDASAVPDAGRAWIEIVCRYLVGADPAEAAATLFVGVPSAILRDLDHYDTAIAGGTTRLVEAMLAEREVPVELGARVTAVEQDGPRLRLRTDAGDTLSTEAVVAALPLNVWRGVAWPASVAARIGELADLGHAGRSVKVWLEVSGVPGLVRASDAAGVWAYVRTWQRLPGGRSMLVAFAAEADVSAVSLDAASVEASLQPLLPGVRVLRIDTHDWNGDRDFAGSWLAARARHKALAGRARALEDGVVFAGADVSAVNAATLDGAIASGSAAAAAVLASR